MPCQCDNGEHITLHTIDIKELEKTDFVNDVFYGNQYSYIRNSFLNNKLPYPEHCIRCAWLRRGANADVLNSKRIKVMHTLHIEPSFLCNLSCHCCVPLSERKEKQSLPYNMPFALFEKIISDFSRNGINVKNLFIAGRGEPLMNKETYKMIRYFKACFPEGKARLDTNGNVEFKDDILHCGLDMISFSIDGTNQTSYSKYRRNGDFNKAYTFMENIIKEKQKKMLTVPILAWKYILLRWNDSRTEIRKSVELFKRIKPDRFIYVLTVQYGKSKVNTYRKLQSVIGKEPKVHPISLLEHFRDLSRLKQYSIACMDWYEEFGYRDVRRQLLIRLLNKIKKVRPNMNYDQSYIQSMSRFLYS
jgi:wyosine [tRNA(Phe)-imidazoG37] synthetase (radical SAM superfamily)